MDEEEGEGDIFQILTPFFEFNHKLRCIELTTSTLSKSHMTSLVSLLLKSGNQLERIDLSDNYIGDEQASNLINIITGNTMEA